MNKRLSAIIIAMMLGSSINALEPGPNDSSFNGHQLTNEQMLSDYDAMWAALRDSYPFWGVLSRSKPNDPKYFDTVISGYREKLRDAGTVCDESMFGFLSAVAYSLYDACGTVGHVSIVNPDYFTGLAVYEKYADSMPEVRPWANAIKKPEVVSFYEYYRYLMESMMKEKAVDAGSDDETAQTPEETREAETKNLTLRILEKGKTAYVKVDSFDDAFIDADLPRIKTFMEDVKDFENLIIDIRENGGGNTDYWENAFVKPNISEPVASRLIRLMKDTDLTRRFYGPQYVGSSANPESLLADARYRKLVTGDMDGLTRMRELVNVTAPDKQGTPFGGKIWLLIGPEVYSSAEAFAVFCKDTGFATLVGKTTGGSDSGGPILFELPNSHLLVQFDVEYCLNADGSCNQESGTAPDIESENALEAALDAITTR